MAKWVQSSNRNAPIRKSSPKYEQTFTFSKYFKMKQMPLIQFITKKNYYLKIIALFFHPKHKKHVININKWS